MASPQLVSPATCKTLPLPRSHALPMHTPSSNDRRTNQILGQYCFSDHPISLPRNSASATIQLATQLWRTSIPLGDSVKLFLFRTLLNTTFRPPCLDCMPTMAEDHLTDAWPSSHFGMSSPHPEATTEYPHVPAQSNTEDSNFPRRDYVHLPYCISPFLCYLKSLSHPTRLTPSCISGLPRVIPPWQTARRKCPEQR